MAIFLFSIPKAFRNCKRVPGKKAKKERHPPLQRCCKAKANRPYKNKGDTMPMAPGISDGRRFESSGSKK